MRQRSKYSGDDLVERRLLDATGRPMADVDGVAIYRWEYDSKGKQVKTIKLDKDEKPVSERR
jgi:hypothetical protein